MPVGHSPASAGRRLIVAAIAFYWDSSGKTLSSPYSVHWAPRESPVAVPSNRYNHQHHNIVLPMKGCVDCIYKILSAGHLSRARVMSRE